MWVALFVVGWLLLGLINREPTRQKYSPPPPPPVDTRPALIPQELINHAVHHNLTDRAAVAPFGINTSGRGYYFVKLVDLTTGKDAFYVFVHAGIPVEVDVPLGRYELRYAAGTTWYGMEHMFGYDTVYSKSATALDFTFDGRRYMGNTITLYMVRNGNMRTERIDKGSF